MTLRVVGAGLGRTARIREAGRFEQLSMRPVTTCSEIFQHPEDTCDAERGRRCDARLHKLFANYRAAVDWPRPAYWERACRRVPDAIVVLSTRPPTSGGDADRTIWGSVRLPVPPDPVAQAQ